MVTALVEMKKNWRQSKWPPKDNSELYYGIPTHWKRERYTHWYGKMSLLPRGGKAPSYKQNF